jgi:VanZ family protein
MTVMKILMEKAGIRITAAAAWAALIFYYSTVPPAAPPGTPADVSWMHFPAYFIMAGLWLRALHASGPGWKAPVCAFIISAGYGLLMECWQLLLPGREFSLADAGLNAAGGGMAVLIASALKAVQSGKCARTTGC